MRIERLNIYKISIPFTGDFSISRLKGRSSNNVVVEVIADQGEIRGYGEAIPVEFVTGETPETALKSAGGFIRNSAFPWDLNDVSEIWAFVDVLPGCKEHNAAVCATEMAILDALGKAQEMSVIEYFPQYFRAETVSYGAQVTLGGKERVMELCKLIKSLGINHLRIKMDGDFHRNRLAIETVKKVFFDGCELRIDPNCVWDRDLAFRHIPLIKEYNVKIVEEPMVRDSPDFPEFARIMRDNDIILMACESAPTLEDVAGIFKENYYQMVNVKLSRSGGFRRTLKIVEYLRSHMIPFQIGCTIGESGILSAAGRTLCLLCKDAVYCDGSYDRFILKENTTNEDVSFGPGGEAGPLDGPGLGVEVSSEKLKRLCSDDSSSITVSRP